MTVRRSTRVPCALLIVVLCASGCAQVGPVNPVAAPAPAPQSTPAHEASERSWVGPLLWTIAGLLLLRAVVVAKGTSALINTPPP